MTLKQAIKDPSWLLARMSNQKVEGNDGPGFRHVRCPKMLWEELVRLVEGLKVEEGASEMSPPFGACPGCGADNKRTDSGTQCSAGCAMAQIKEAETRMDEHKKSCMYCQLDSFEACERGKELMAGAAQHLKREQELEITAAQAEVLDAILAEHTTDSVDYELAADDMGAALFGGVGKWAGKALLSEKQREQEPSESDALRHAFVEHLRENCRRLNVASVYHSRFSTTASEVYDEWVRMAAQFTQPPQELVSLREATNRLSEFVKEREHYAQAECFESEGQDEQDPDNCQKCALEQILEQFEAALTREAVGGGRSDGQD